MVNFVNILVTIVVTLAKWMNFWKNKGRHLTQPTTRLALRQYVITFLYFRVKLQQLFLDALASLRPRRPRIATDNLRIQTWILRLSSDSF